MKFFSYLMIFFCVGVFVALVLDNLQTSPYTKESVNQGYSGIVVVDEAILFSDIDFECEFFLRGGEIDYPGSDYAASYSVLWNEVLLTTVERKVLYKAAMKSSLFRNSNNLCKQKRPSLHYALSEKANALFSKYSGSVSLIERRVCEKEVIRNFLETAIYARIKISKSEILREYEQNMADFYVDPQIISRHVLLGNEHAALNFKSRVTKANFSNMAKKFSLSYEASAGGKLAPYEKKTFPAVFDVGFSMKKGQISDILRSSYGFHILFIEDNLPKQLMSFEQVQEKIKNELLTRKKEKVYARWLKISLEEASIFLL